MKLSFAGVSKLRLDYHEWLNGGTTAGYEHFRRDLITYGIVYSPYLAAWLSNVVRYAAFEDPCGRISPGRAGSLLRVRNSLDLVPFLTATQFRAWTRDWRLELGL